MISVRRHPLLALSTWVVIMLVGAYFLHRRMSPTYEAESVIYVSPIFPKELADDHEHDRQYENYMEQQITSLPSLDTMREALEANPGVWRLPEESEQSAATRLQSALKVTQKGRSYLVGISLQSPSPNHLADLINSITSIYLRKARQAEFYGTDERLKTLGAEKDRTQQLLNDKLKEQAVLLQQMGMAHFDATSSADPLDVQLSKLRDQLSDAHEKRIEADAQLASLNSVGGNTGMSTLDEAAEAEVNQDPSVSGLKAGLASHRANLLTQMGGLTPQNPVRRQAEAELKQTDDQLDSISKTYRHKKALEIQQRYAGVRQRALQSETQLQNDLLHTMGSVVAAGPKLQRAEILSSEIDRIKTAYAVVDARIQSLILEGSSPGSVHLDSPATTPTSPASKKTPLFIAALVLLSLAGAVVVAVIANLLDPKIYTSDEVKGIIGFPPIGMLLAESEFDGKIEEEYFVRLTGGIDHALRRTGARTLVFTSVGSGSVAPIVKRLGSELTDNGLRTLVILASGASSGETPAASSAPTASTPAAASSPTELKTRAENGQTPLSVATLNASGLSGVLVMPPTLVPQFLRENRSFFDSILIASDPVLTSAYTENLTRVADGTVLVINSGKTTKEQMARASKLLERLKIAGIAAILQNIRRNNDDYVISRSVLDYSMEAQEAGS